MRYNSQMCSIFADTLVAISMKNGDQALKPSLNVASVPVCNEPAPSCLLSGSCTLTTDKTAALQLCSSSSSCSSSTTPDYVDNLFFVVYFEEALPS